MKKLYVLISNGGDGSYYPHFTFNEDWIKKQELAYDNGELEYDSLGCDGDGFHYEILTVPDECTLESLSIEDCSL